MGRQLCEFDEAKFLSDFNNSDDDYVFNALNDLIRFLLRTDDCLERVISVDSLSYISFLVLGRLSDVGESPNLASLIFRVTQLFAAKLPLTLLKGVFDAIFDAAARDDGGLLPQLTSVLCELLSGAPAFDGDRQSEIIDCLFPRLELGVRQSGDASLFHADVLAALLAHLGSAIGRDRIDRVFDLVGSALRRVSDRNAGSVSALAREAALLFTREQQSALLSGIMAIGDGDCRAAVLSAVVAHCPAMYRARERELLGIIGGWLEREGARLAGGDAAQERAAESVSQLLLSAAFVVGAADGVTRDEAAALIGACFRFLTHDANAEYGDGDEECGSDGDVLDDSDMEDADDLDEGLRECDSWKVRKSAVYLAKVLIRKFPEQFYDTLVFQDESVNNFVAVDLLIHDRDFGVQKDAFRFFEVLVDNYGESLGSDNIEYLIGSIVSQFVPEKTEVFNVALMTIASIIKKRGKIGSELIVQVLQCLTPIAKDSFVTSMLNFVQVVMEVYDEPDLIDPIGLLVVHLFNDQKIKSKTYLLNAAAKLFKYSNGVMKPVLEQLLEIIIAMAKEKGKKDIKTIESLAIFIASFPDSPLLEKSIDVIMKCSNLSVQTTVDSLALIAASPSRKILQKYLNDIFNVLLKQLSSLDRAITFHSLWAIRIFIEFKLFDEKIINQEFIKSLLQIILKGDYELCHITFEIFTVISNAALNYLDDFVKIILNQHFPDDIIEIFLKFISNCYLINQDLVKSFIPSFLKSEQNIDNISRIIGFAGHLNIDFGLSLLKIFEEQILKENKNSPLSILCVGELGSHFDISSHDELIHKLFDLLNSPDRSIFSSASKCIGLISICSTDNVLNKILNSIESNNSQLTLWVSSLLSFVSRKTDLNIEKSKQILDCLYKVADYSKETSDQIAKIFSIIIQHHKEFINDFFTLISTNPKSGPVALNGISLYIETTPNDTSDLIEKVISFIDPQKPILSKYGMCCIKIWLNQPTTAPKLSSYFSLICDCVKTLPEHTVLQYYGSTPVNTDIGLPLRLHSIDNAIQFFSLFPESTTDESITGVSILSLEDSKIEVKLRGYQLISSYALHRLSSPPSVELLTSLVREFVSSESDAFNARHPSDELEHSFLRTLLHLRKLTSARKFPDLEKLYAHHRHDSRLQQLERDSDDSQSTDCSSTCSPVPISAISLSLLTSFYPAAAAISRRSRS